MKKKIAIALTCREIKLKRQNEIFDSVDQNWFSFFKKCNFELKLYLNNDQNLKKFIQKNNIQGFVLSGGGPITKNIGLKIKKFEGLNANRDIIETKIFNYCYKQNLPLLGVCRGMEVINILLKGKIKKLLNHRNKIHKLKPVYPEYKRAYSIDKYVNSYHDFGIIKETLSKELIPIYYSGKSIEMCLSKRKKIMGIMWHPERNKKFSINDIKLFKNFFSER